MVILTFEVMSIGLLTLAIVFPGAAVTKSYKPGGLNNRNLFSHSSGN